MKQKRDEYENPLTARWGSPEISRLFSPEFKFTTWRRLWLALAESEKELGLEIPGEAIKQMRAHLEDINYERAEEFEKELRHDVMSHVRAFGEQCPAAGPIIHLGATSCYVTDNTELIQLREGLKLLAEKTAAVIKALADFAREYRELPVLGFTHFQPAQPTTAGKRATLWIQDLLIDLAEIERLAEQIPFRGIKGTTGTQASFLALFDGDHEKVEKLDELVTRKMGFSKAFPVTGQTYPRKMDKLVIDSLAGIAVSAHKFANDVRLLANRKEIEEPFGNKQVGSSAMAYKRNPMRCERMTGIARYLLSLQSGPAMTAAEQWLERTLDDSANRRLAIAEAFLAADVVLTIYLNVARGLVVYPEMIKKNLSAELPFMATEEILMAAVRAGGDRQELHEAIRVHSQAAAKAVKLEGRDNDLLDRLKNDPMFSSVKDSLDELTAPELFIGRAPRQVEAFLAKHVEPALKKYGGKPRHSSELSV